MRALAVGALVGAAAIFAAAPAEARPQAFSGSLSMSGGVAVTWHGSPSGGCKGAGLCGYSGSASTQPRAEGELFILSERGRRTFVDGTLYSEDTAVARVSRREPDGTSDACVDVAQLGELEVIAKVRRSRARLGLAGRQLVTGRCAGPDLAKLLSRVSSANASVARLKRGQTTLDLSARVPFRSGHFAGRIVSTLRLHVGELHGERVIDDGPPPHRGTIRRRRAVDLHSVYSVTALAGTLTTSFHGLEAPLCDAVDACGVSGVESWAILSRGGTVVVDANALAKPSDHGLRGLLTGVRRRGSGGSVEVEADLRHEVGTTSARVDRAGAVSCHDSQSALPPQLYAPGGRTGSLVQLGEPSFDGSGPDLLRTGCPGPTQADVVGRHALATGRLPLGALGKRQIVLRLRGGAHFDDGAYAGAWRGAFTLRLRRVKQQLVYHYEQVSP